MMQQTKRTSELDPLSPGAALQRGISHLILVELIARSLKASLHRKMRHLRSMEDDHYRCLVVSFFNIVFCQSSPELTARYWKTVKEHVKAKYPKGLSELEENDTFDLRASIDLDMLYHRLQTLAGVSFSRQDLFPAGFFEQQQEDNDGDGGDDNNNGSNNDLLSVDWDERRRRSPLPPQARFSESDFIGLHARGKFTYTIPRIEADTAVELARRSQNMTDTESLLELAREKYLSVLRLKPDDHVVLAST